jgi:hypothetical protein
MSIFDDDDEAGGHTLLDPRVDQQAFADARRDKGTPMVQLAYPRKGIWSGHNQLGVELPFEPDVNREQTIFKLDEWGFPQIWTISLAFTIEKELIPGQIFDAVGEINFGSGGIVQTFEVDWVVGTTFSLPMNAVNVRARWNDVAAFGGFLPPGGARLSVIAARGSTRHARATKTEFFAIPGLDTGPLVGPQSTVVLPIPSFAKSVIITPVGATDAAAIYSAGTFLQFLPNIDPTLPAPLPVLTVPGALGATLLLGPNASYKVPIPALAHYWRIATIAPPATVMKGAAIFNLFDE